MKTNQITFPKFKGIRCLMMPYTQGDPESIPPPYRMGYESILASVFVKRGDIGFLTIDESRVIKGMPHRGTHAKHGRALHTEAGRHPDKVYGWGDGGGWGKKHSVTLDRDVKVLLANNVDKSCAIWETEHLDTSLDGDIGHLSEQYPYEQAVFMLAGEVHEIGILTPHESIPVTHDVSRQFLRIVSSGVHGREQYFTENPLVSHAA
jgi:hypothetical protein